MGMIGTGTGTDPAYFTKAVTQLGEQRPVVTTNAIFNVRGVKILEKGVPINPGLYERLMAHKLTVPLEHSVTSAPTVNGKFLRAHAEQAMHEVPFFARIGAEAKVRSLMLESLERMALPEPMAFQLLLACEVRPELFRRSIHAALFAAWMTQATRVSRVDIGVAAAAGLLHDIGMLHLDPTLLTPREVIGDDQRRQLYAHSLVSKVLIERHHEYPSALIRAVTEHHEFLDGSGYPCNLSGQGISSLGRILSLGNLVTAMLAPEHQVYELHLSLKLRMNRHRYDATLVERVQDALKPPREWQEVSLASIVDSVSRLQAIDASVSDWPAELALHPDLSPNRREGVSAVAAQAAQLRRTMANVGVAPQQLNQLGCDELDHSLQFELTLMAQEAAWQLRYLSRQIKQRWCLAADVRYPPVLQKWLDRADGLVTNMHRSRPSGLSDAHRSVGIPENAF